jgi:hypothetical protein
MLSEPWAGSWNDLDAWNCGSWPSLQVLASGRCTAVRMTGMEPLASSCEYGVLDLTGDSVMLDDAGVFGPH